MLAIHVTLCNSTPTTLAININNDKTTGGKRHRVTSAGQRRATLCVTARAVWTSMAGGLQNRHQQPPVFFSHSSLSPPFHHATACPTNIGCMQWSMRRSSDRKRATTAPRVEERLGFRERTQSGLGVLQQLGESPQKIGWWGAKRVEETETRLTMSAFNLPQFTHIHSNIFFTFTMKPG